MERYSKKFDKNTPYSVSKKQHINIFSLSYFSILYKEVSCFCYIYIVDLTKD